MNISDYLKSKHFEYKSDGSLFGVDLLIAVVDHKCPYCFNKLYPMRSKPFHYCKSKKHKNRFIISNSKLQ